MRRRFGARNRDLRVVRIIAVTLASILYPACANRSEPSTPANAPASVTKVTYAVDKCSFNKFTPREANAPSEYGKALLYKLGTGILQQKGGSLCKLQCPDGNAFPAWIDFDGNPISALFGLGWLMNTVSYSPGRTDKPHLWEKRGTEWVEVLGTFRDVTMPLPSGSKASSAVYTVFSTSSVSEYSARLLNYFGIGLAGKGGKVKLMVGDYAGTGVLSPVGTVSIESETKWSEPID